MIIKISEQGEKLSAMAAEMDGAEDLRIEKEEELKYVEAQLVNTLIEQQRKLMGVLQTVSVDPAKYGMDFAPGGGELNPLDLKAPHSGDSQSRTTADILGVSASDAPSDQSARSLADASEVRDAQVTR